MNKLFITDLPLKGKKVLMRVDFNVPLAPDGTITDDSRIVAELPSIQYVLKQGGALILMSHLGRPKPEFDPKYSLAPVAKRLESYLGKSVPLAPDCIGPEVEKLVDDLKSGECLLLENVRFHIGEEEPEQDPTFVKELASLGDVYINDAFGAAHRAHSSTALIAKYFPGKAAAGFLMKQEIDALNPLLHNPDRPFYAIIGGAKISTKTGVIYNLLKQVDALFIGGAMTYTFLKAKGIDIGASLYEESEIKTAHEILEKAPCIYLPLDLVIADSFANDAQTKILPTSENIPEGWQGMDIGPKTVELWTHLLAKASTIFWNGPLGVFEMESFAKGTQKIALSLAESPASVIVGGGDSVAAIRQMGLEDRFTHLSTGGGAALEFIEFGHLPGIDALSPK
jgi:phosphoglycerate kinase